MLNKYILSLLFSFILLIIICAIAGKYYIQTMLPVYKYIITAIEPRYNVTSLLLRDEDNQSIIALSVEYNKRRYIEMHRIEQGIRLSSQTLASYSLQHLIVIFTPLFAWISIGKKHYGRILVTGGLLLIFMEIVDIPYVLTGSMEELLLITHAGQPTKSAIVVWANFMDGGGRIVLSLGLSMLILIVLGDEKKKKLLLTRSSKCSRIS